MQVTSILLKSGLNNNVVVSYTFVDVVVYGVGLNIQKAWDQRLSGFGDFLDLGSLAKKMGTDAYSTIKTTA
jgi:hypothetical protein